MASLEDELRDLRQKNNDLAQKVQYLKMIAGQRENEKLDLMKEINELRLKLSRIRSNGSVQASNLDVALQSAAQKALAYLVKTSGEIATMMDLAKAYMRDREELNNESPRWSSLSNTPSAKKDKVHRVPPLMIGGQSIQPVVALTMLDTSNARSAARSSSVNRNVTERAVPMHMLQDVYIPLTRIDVQTQNMETEDTNDADDSTEHLQLDDNEENVVEDSQRMDEDEDFDSTRILDAVAEDTEPENDDETPPRNRIENPLEGPSWMLDTSSNSLPSASKSRMNLEPDSTTGLEDFRDSPLMTDKRNKTEGTTQLLVPSPPPRLSREFSPTVRRRKRSSSPPAATPRRASHYSPRPPPPRRISNSGRVLKVLVAKMRLDAAVAGGAGGADGEEAGAGGSPPKRAAPGAALAASHAPSPNGATVAGVIVSETSQDELDSLSSGEPSPQRRHRHRDRPAPAPSAAPSSALDANIADWTDDMEQQRINVDRRTKSKDRAERTKTEQNERTDNRERNIETDDNIEGHQINIDARTNRDQNEWTNNRERNMTSDDNIEESHINFNRRTNSRDKSNHTNSRERNKQKNREHTMEMQDSQERNERSSRNQNERTNSKERTNSRERSINTNRDQMDMQTDRERNQNRRTNSAERCDRQRTNSVDRTEYRHKQSRSRDRSHEGQEEGRADSRASNDSGRQDDVRAASSYRGRAGSCDSDSGSGGEREGRTRRTRRVVTYKERPLNRKMRR